MNPENLRELREDLGLKQEEMAKIIGVKRSTYTHYENGTSTMTIEQLNILSTKFNKSLDFLSGLSRTDNKKYKPTEINTSTIGKRLKQMRLDNKLSQEKLAEKLNTYHPRISDYENGKRITIPVLINYANFFHTSIDYLCSKE